MQKYLSYKALKNLNTVKYAKNLHDPMKGKGDN